MSSFWKLLLKAGWAPLGVVVFHALVVRTPLRSSLDFPIHFMGGAAIAYFFWQALGCFGNAVGKITVVARYVFSFALACTVGLFWEFGELLSDVVLHTNIQISLHETFSDLIADTTGAVLSLCVVALFTLLRRGCR